MLEIDIVRNSSPKKVGVLRVAFKGLGVQKDTQRPCWLRPWVPVLDMIPDGNIKREFGILFFVTFSDKLLGSCKTSQL